MTEFDLYAGKGKTLHQRLGKEIPRFESIAGDEDPSLYQADDGLRDAVNVALALGQPLLVTGEPGTGKTRLAASVAWELNLPLLEFHTQTASTAADLFYHFDYLRRFHDANAEDLQPLESYVTCHALGLAILLARESADERVLSLLPPDPAEWAEDLRKRREGGPSRSVVLIDEIDKAPRDLPNDILDEVERMRFRVRETTWPAFEAATEFRPVLILTSNSEKNLPDAFLRRCVFYHIPFPGEETLRTIVRNRFGEDGFDDDFLNRAIAGFQKIRDELNLKKKPATAEFLNWIGLLRALEVDVTDPDSTKLKSSLSVLAKNKDDLDRLRDRAAALFPGKAVDSGI